MNFKLFSIAAFALAALAMAGCQNEDPNDTHFDNKLYISASNFTDAMLIKSDVAQYERTITVGIAKPETHDIDIVFGVDDHLVETYREAYYDPEAVLLPEEHWEIPETNTRIEAGNVKSAPVTVNFLNTNKLDRNAHYVLPVTLRSVTGIDVLSSAKTVYYIFKAGALINVVADIEKNYCRVTWKNPAPVKNLTQVTMEALVRARYFSRSGSDSEIVTVMGIEGYYLIRCGDSNGSGQIQVATSSGNFPGSDPAKVLPANTWLHIALTHDLSTGDYAIYVNGVKKSSGVSRLGSLDLTRSGSDNAGFNIGRSWNDNRWWPGEIGEVRIWNRVLSEEEINAKDHFYMVDPASEGLVAYWKFDDAAGEIIKDHTANGNDAVASSALKWTAVSLPETNK